VRLLTDLFFLPEPHVLLAYSLACLVLFVTPGPDMSLFLAKTISGGKRAGLAAMLGAEAGCCVHTLFAAIGLSALIAASATAFTVVKVVGALYLLWLAIDAIRNGSALNLKPERDAKPSLRRIFLMGLGINLTNPKIVLFFVTFLPQFVEAGDPNAGARLCFLGLYFVAFTAPMNVLLVLAAGRVVHLLQARPRILRGLDYGFAAIFGAFAVRILTTKAR
jgi:threonine/homoserine/homoserine lactone efflux protein